MFEEIMATVLGQGIGYSLLVVMAMILLDAVFGVLAAIRTGEFDLEKIKQFLVTNLLPYLGGLGLLAAGALFISPEVFGAIYGVVVLSVGAGYLKSIYAKIETLFGVKLTYDCVQCGRNLPYDSEAFSVTPGPLCPWCRGNMGVDLAAEEEAADGD